MSLDAGPFEWQDAPQADFAVIGDPVAHSLSPRMHAAAYRALGLELRYVAIRVDVGAVESALAHLTAMGYRGVNVTVPHKEEALRWSAQPDDLSVKVRAANTLRLIDGASINTDAPGFADTLANRDAVCHRALLLGAGGSARAVAVALIGLGVEVRFFNRTQSKAEALASELGLAASTVLVSPDAEGCSLVVNATSAGLAGQELEIDWSRAEPDALAYHLMYGPKAEPFLSSARAAGLETLDGRPLLAAQGARSFEWWLDMPAPREVMLEALE